MIVDAKYRRDWFQAAKNVSLNAAQVAFLDAIQPGVEQVCWTFLGYSPEQATYTEFLPSVLSERPPLNYGIDVGWDVVGGTAVSRSRTDTVESGVQLSAVPVRSVVSVYENTGAWTTGEPDGYWPASTLLPASTYRLDMQSPGLCKSGRLVRVYGTWFSNPRSIKVTYVAGYTQTEIDAQFAPLKLAVVMALNWWYARALRQSRSVPANGMTPYQVSIRDFSVSMGDPNGIGAGDGPWAQNVLGPESLTLLWNFVNMAKFMGNM